MWVKASNYTVRYFFKEKKMACKGMLLVFIGTALKVLLTGEVYCTVLFIVALHEIEL